MIRLATRADIPAILAIRDDPGDAPLSDPGAVGDSNAIWLIENGALWVWQETDGPVAGFAAIGVVQGSILALLVAPGQQGKGIGRALLAVACDALRAAGHATAAIALEPGTAAVRHYRAAGWTEAGHDDNGDAVFRKPL